MKKNIYIILIFISSLSLLNCQNSKKDELNKEKYTAEISGIKKIEINELKVKDTVRIGFLTQPIIDSLKANRDQKWINKSPRFKNISKSFFTDKNTLNLLIVPVYISGFGIPFSTDCTFSVLDFLNKKHTFNQTDLYRVNNELSNITEVKWKELEKVKIWINGQSFQTRINNYYLYGTSDFNECPGTIDFSSFYYHKIPELRIENPLTNNLTGLAFIGTDFNLDSLIETKSELVTENDIKIEGVGYDINNDNILDVFHYYEMIDDISSYGRMYLNIGGNWILLLNDYEQVCV